MIIIETCPRCGCDLYDTAVCTNPVIVKKECFKCGWSYSLAGDQEKVARIPFGVNDDYLINQRYPRDPCANCSNNPKNGGSGVCHCILGQKWFY